MKNYLPIIAALALLAAAAWFFVFRKNAPMKISATANAETASTPPAWWTPQGVQAATGFVTSAFDGLKNLSNAFGWNDGGNSDGVSVGGSAAGGIQSSGSGAGLFW